VAEFALMSSDKKKGLAKRSRSCQIARRFLAASPLLGLRVTDSSPSHYLSTSRVFLSKMYAMRHCGICLVLAPHTNEGCAAPQEQVWSSHPPGAGRLHAGQAKAPLGGWFEKQW